MQDSSEVLTVPIEGGQAKDAEVHAGTVSLGEVSVMTTQQDNKFGMADAALQVRGGVVSLGELPMLARASSTDVLVWAATLPCIVLIAMGCLRRWARKSHKKRSSLSSF
mmetsp:Transcript_53186/g.152416  ORF Transcript_53186/g.152416 Transcript_53186/m.152416 type:complete len:109 (-) Transcript_53186:167-493(-)